MRSDCIINKSMDKNSTALEVETWYQDASSQMTHRAIFSGIMNTIHNMAAYFAALVSRLKSFGSSSTNHHVAYHTT